MNIIDTTKNYDHPLDILDFLIKKIDAGQQVALVAVTVRSSGAIVGVSSDGVIAGHISNGCVDSNLIFQSIQAIKSGMVSEIRFGAGSDFKDLKLPCGGAIDLFILPNPDRIILENAKTALEQRRDLNLYLLMNGEISLETKNVFTSSDWLNDGASHNQYRIYIRPKLQLRIAGVGAEMIALSRIAIASGFDVIIQCPKQVFLTQAEEYGALRTDLLITPEQLPDIHDDQWTAFVLMFHDHDWELELLRTALEQNAFYIGALGSRKTHAIRRDRLRAINIPEDDIERIHGPIGLVPSLRDASMVSISSLSEIIQEYNHITS